MGFGWEDFEVAWSSKSDASIGTVKHLIEHLKLILEAEATREIPEAPHCRAPKRKKVAQLGGQTHKAEELDSNATAGLADLQAAAVAERERREGEGIGDSYQTRQPTRPPALDSSLVGKRLEVRYPVQVEDADGELTGERDFVWWPCEVLRVSDGSVPKVGRQGKELKSCQPKGALLLRWAAVKQLRWGHVTDEWFVPCPGKWKSDQMYAWRYDLQPEALDKEAEIEMSESESE